MPRPQPSLRYRSAANNRGNSSAHTIAGDPLNTCVNGGESLADYRRRVDGFLAWLVEQPLPCVLLVAHEETLRIFDAFFSGRGLADVVGKSFANCVPYVFQPASEN